jgi:hypothetical protein
MALAVLLHFTIAKTFYLPHLVSREQRSTSAFLHSCNFPGQVWRKAARAKARILAPRITAQKGGFLRRIAEPEKALAKTG